MRLIFSLLVALTLSACAGKTVKLTTEFDAAEVSWFNLPGNNVIEGQAFVQTRGGVPRTCAGNGVGLVPKSRYADERMLHIYGTSGYRPVTLFNLGVKFESNSADYAAYSRKTKCDADGNFRFDELPDGEYYVTTSIIWQVPSGTYTFESQGGHLMTRVKVSGGQTERVLLSP